METICGADCNKCDLKKTCKGCIETDGHPFGGDCVLANCCNNKASDNCQTLINEYKSDLIKEFNSLKISDMPEVTELFALNGSFINMEYSLSNGMKIKFLNDNNIYLGAQLQKNNTDKCYGLAADNNYLLVCEYGEDGVDPEIVVFKKRNVKNIVKIKEEV